MLMKFRERARRLGLRWMRRRSQKNRDLSWEAYQEYLEHHPLPLPGRIVDLIAMGRSAVKPGEKYWLGAGCVNGASPVLRGFGVQLDKDKIL